MLCSAPSRRLGAEPPVHVVRRMRKDFEVVLRRSRITTGRNQAAGTRQQGTCARRSDRSAQETWATVRMIVRIAAKAVVRMYQERATRLAAAGERGFRLASPWRVDLGWFVRGAGVFRDAEAGPPGHRNIKPFLRPGGEGGGDRWAGAMAATESGGIPSGPRGPWCSRSRAEDRRALRSDPWQ